MCRAFVCLAGDCAEYDDPLNTLDDLGEALGVECDDCGKWAPRAGAAPWRGRRDRRDPDVKYEEEPWTEEDSYDEYGTSKGPAYICCDGSGARPGCGKWLCNVASRDPVDGKYVQACANNGNGGASARGGGGAVFCMRCGCSCCHQCSPAMVSCSRYDGGEDMCGKNICADCAWEAPQMVRCNVCRDMLHRALQVPMQDGTHE